ncbi:MAG: DNA primase [Deltaproteobacteria bacterium]|nr:DNA primase [Deltaproteobacteria bacterium]
MGRIPEDTIQAVRERVDIVALIGRHVSLKRAGRSWKGLCPFHQEKTPSFHVNPERGAWHCFGCEEGGDAVAFAMRQEGLTFPEALRSLAAEIGIEVPESGGGERGVSEQVLRANQVAQQLYTEALWGGEGQEARSYLKSRGLGAEDARLFGLGFAPRRWDALRSALSRAEISVELGLRAGLLREGREGGHYDPLRGRLSFPIQDARGRIIGFGGRALQPEQQAKYLNTSESPVFHKRRAFYGFPHALEAIRKRGRAVVVEGYFDRIAAQRAGLAESVATCGTALSEEHARDLRRRTEEVVLLFDGDESGQRAMLRSLSTLLSQGLRVRAAALPNGADPDDFLRSQGAEALAGLVESAPPALEIAMARAAAAGCATPWQRADAVNQVAPLLALLADSVERGEFSRQLAQHTGAEPRDIEAAVQRLRGGAAAEPPPPAPRRRSPEERHYETALRLLLDQPALRLPLAEAPLLDLAPGDGWRALAELVLRARSGPRRLDVLLGEQPPALRARLSALATAERPDIASADAALAQRMLEDALRRLADWRRRSESRAFNRRMRAADESAQAKLLAQKQQQLEQRRAELQQRRPEEGAALH